MPGPVVCLLLKGGFVAEVGDVTVDVVNLPEDVAVDVDVATVVVAEVVLVIEDVVVAMEDGDGGFASETLDVGMDFSSILSELEFSEDDGLEAFDVLEDTLSAFSAAFSTAFSTAFSAACVVFVTSFLVSMLGLSMFLPKKVIARICIASHFRAKNAREAFVIRLGYACYATPRSWSDTKARL